jgi:hypothetical protein
MHGGSSQNIILDYLHESFIGEYQLFLLWNAMMEPNAGQISGRKEMD